MKYRIEYADNRKCSVISSRTDLLERLKILSADAVSDIRKLYKSGVSDSVLDAYKLYLNQ